MMEVLVTMGNGAVMELPNIVNVCKSEDGIYTVFEADNSSHFITTTCIVAYTIADTDEQMNLLPKANTEVASH